MNFEFDSSSNNLALETATLYEEGLRNIPAQEITEWTGEIFKKNFRAFVRPLQTCFTGFDDVTDEITFMGIVDTILANAIVYYCVFIGFNTIRVTTTLLSFLTFSNIPGIVDFYAPNIEDAGAVKAALMSHSALQLFFTPIGCIILALIGGFVYMKILTVTASLVASGFFIAAALSLSGNTDSSLLNSWMYIAAIIAPMLIVFYYFEKIETILGYVVISAHTTFFGIWLFSVNYDGVIAPKIFLVKLCAALDRGDIFCPEMMKFIGITIIVTVLQMMVSTAEKTHTKRIQRKIEVKVAEVKTKYPRVFRERETKNRPECSRCTKEGVTFVEVKDNQSEESL